MCGDLWPGHEWVIARSDPLSHSTFMTMISLTFRISSTVSLPYTMKRTEPLSVGVKAMYQHIPSLSTIYACEPEGCVLVHEKTHFYDATLTPAQLKLPNHAVLFVRPPLAKENTRFKLHFAPKLAEIHRILGIGYGEELIIAIPPPLSSVDAAEEEPAPKKCKIESPSDNLANLFKENPDMYVVDQFKNKVIFGFTKKSIKLTGVEFEIADIRKVPAVDALYRKWYRNPVNPNLVD